MFPVVPPWLLLAPPLTFALSAALWRRRKSRRTERERERGSAEERRAGRAAGEIAAQAVRSVPGSRGPGHTELSAGCQNRAACRIPTE